MSGIRFFAAIGVAAHHVFARTLDGVWWPVASLIDRLGDASVSLFFVLSGIVLAVSEVKRGQDSRRSRREFWLARMARIYPLYAVAMLLALPAAYLAYLDAGVAPATIASRLLAIAALCFLLLQAWTPFTGTLNPPSWSLSVETFFYFLFPFFVGIVWRNGRSILLVAVTGWLVAALCYAVAFPTPGPVRVVAGVSLLFFPPLRLAEFVVGVCAGGWLARRAGAPRPVGAAPLPMAAMLTWLIVAAVVPEPWYRFLSLPVTTAVLMLLARSGNWSRTLGSRPLIALGAASYALYLVHVPILSYWRFAGAPDPGSPPVFLLYLAVAVVAAVTLHRVVEVPAATWMLSRFGGRGNASREADWSGSNGDEREHAGCHFHDVPVDLLPPVEGLAQVSGEERG